MWFRRVQKPVSILFVRDSPCPPHVHGSPKNIFYRRVRVGNTAVDRTQPTCSSSSGVASWRRCVRLGPTSCPTHSRSHQLRLAQLWHAASSSCWLTQPDDLGGQAQDGDLPYAFSETCSPIDAIICIQIWSRIERDQPNLYTATVAQTRSSQRTHAKTPLHAKCDVNVYQYRTGNKCTDLKSQCMRSYYSNQNKLDERTNRR